MRESTLFANELTFHCLEEGEGPLVLLLHGFPDHARSFRHQLPALAAAGYRAVAPHLRGYHPEMCAADGVYAVPVLAHDVIALIDELSPDRPAVLVGHDWGAAIAYAAALQAPERIEKLVTMAVPYGPSFLESLLLDPEQQRRSWYMFFFQLPIAEAAVRANDYAFLARLWREWSPGYRLSDDEWQRLLATFEQPGVLEAALSYYRHAFLPPPEVAAATAAVPGPHDGPIAVPTLYLHGEQDGCIGADVAAAMGRDRKQLFPYGLELVFFQGAGHFLHQELPDEVNDRLLEFLAGEEQR